MTTTTGTRTTGKTTTKKTETRDAAMRLRENMNELSLFTGAGGGLLATQHLLGFRTVCYVEIDGYCQEILKARIRDGLLDDAPIWDDVRTFDGRPWRGCVDIVTAGFPCQPFSTAAGVQPGEQDKRNLWPDTIRVIREVQPRWVLLENVPMLLVLRYAGTVFGDLAASGFCVRWDCLHATALGADHRRDRLWVVADARCPGRERHQLGFLEAKQRFVRHTPRCCSRSSRDTLRRGSCLPTDVCRKRDAVAKYVDRLRVCGEGQVPAVVAKAWELLSQQTPQSG